MNTTTATVMNPIPSTAAPTDIDPIAREAAAECAGRVLASMNDIEAFQVIIAAAIRRAVEPWEDAMNGTCKRAGDVRNELLDCKRQRDELWNRLYEAPAIDRALDEQMITEEVNRILRQKLTEARAVLKAVEWSAGQGKWSWCPVCRRAHGGSAINPHAPGCTLARALGGGE